MHVSHGENSSDHWFERHTGEIELHLRADSAEALFEEAGRALASLMLGEFRTLPPAEEIRTVVGAADEADLLYDWINELIYLSETRKLVFDSFDVQRRAGGTLEATVRGGRPEGLATRVKAATLHRLTWDDSGETIEATIILDV